MTKYDVIVIGAGTWGSSASLELAKRGYRIMALDAFKPPHNRGSHGGATRLARQSNSSGEAYIPLTERTFQLWDSIAKMAGQQILVRTGSAFIGQPGSQWFDNTLGNLKKSRFEYSVLTHQQAQEKFPLVKTREEELTVWEPNGAIILVENAINSLHKLAMAAGVTFRFDEPVTSWSVTSDGVEVTTPDGVYHADKLVITAGAQSANILKMPLPVDVERQVLVNFAIPAGTPKLPALFFAAPPGDIGMPAYGCPDPDGTYKFSFATRQDIIEPGALTQDLRPGDLERVRDVVQQRLPYLDGAPVGWSVCMWSESRDGHWLLGAHPEYDRVIIGAGCTGRGFRYAPVVGEALADFAENKHRPDLETFAMRRYPLASSEA